MVGPGPMVVESGYTVMAYSCPACKGSGWSRRWRWDRYKQKEVLEKCGICRGNGFVLSADEPRLSQLPATGETQ